MGLPLITCVYVSWNTSAELAASLRRLAAIATGPREVVVVDNASSDDTVAMLARDFPDVRVIANADNRGFAAAVNQGWSAGSGAYCLLLNPDALLDEPALTAMREVLSACPTLGACAPLLLTEDGEPTENARPFPAPTLRLDPATRERPHGASLPVPPGPWGEVTRAHWVMGACLLIRREAMAAVGGFDAGYFLYGEDIDFGYRLFRAGWDSGLLTGHQAIHLGDRSSRQVASDLSTMRRHDGYFRYLSQAHGPHVARGVYLWWLLSAGAKALAAWLRRRPTEHELGRLRYGLRHLGRPFWRCQFGRNHAPGGLTEAPQ